MSWRWDQGRLGLFAFENIRAYAKAFATIDGADMASGIDPLRPALAAFTTAVFKPEHRPDYPVWRNHSRVFGCELIATKLNNRLKITDIGRRLAVDENFTADDYLALVSQRFRYPFPAFDDYDSSEELLFPFCAVLKYLCARLTSDTLPFLTVDALAAFIIGNNCTGTEELEHYQNLRETSFRFPPSAVSDAARQAREMLIFISQFSFLQWNNQTLLLDAKAVSIADLLQKIAIPDVIPALPQRQEELLSRGRLVENYEPVELPFTEQESSIELEFSEGRKVRRSHLRTERSALLRKVYFQRFAPTQCDMCRMQVMLRYPWAGNLLELHHLLPLASALAVDKSGTLLTDVVPLCPTCHRGVHSYYRNWLNEGNRKDFANRAEAQQVYNDAKDQIVL